MIRSLTKAVAALSVMGASAASAQVIVRSDPGCPYAYRGPVVVEPYGYQAPYGYQGYVIPDPYASYGPFNRSQCATDEGYGRPGSCSTGGQ